MRESRCGFFGSHFLGKSISEEFWPFDLGVTSWHWFPDCQHFLAGLTPRRVSDTRRWWAQTCGLTLTDSERGYLPIMQLAFHPSFQFCDITVLKWLLWEKYQPRHQLWEFSTWRWPLHFVYLYCERGILSSYQLLSVTTPPATTPDVCGKYPG